ncbi:hypothetical protein ABU952_18825 [Bacillus amyloliquefaciens]
MSEEADSIVKNSIERRDPYLKQMIIIPPSGFVSLSLFKLLPYSILRNG